MNYDKQFEEIKNKVNQGNIKDIDFVMSKLNGADLATTRAVDLYLNYLTNILGIKRLEYYLFKGTQIQKNYCCLFFARRNEWQLIDKAYSEGCIDEIQAYSR